MSLYKLIACVSTRLAGGQRLRQQRQRHKSLDAVDTRRTTSFRHTTRPHPYQPLPLSSCLLSTRRIRYRRQRGAVYSQKRSLLDGPLDNRVSTVSSRLTAVQVCFLSADAQPVIGPNASKQGRVTGVSRAETERRNYPTRNRYPRAGS